MNSSAFVLFLSIALAQVQDADRKELARLALTALDHLARGDVDALRGMIGNDEIVYGKPCTSDINILKKDGTSFSRLVSFTQEAAKKARDSMAGKGVRPHFGESTGVPPYFDREDVIVGDPSFCRWGIIFRRVGGSWKLRGIVLGISAPPPVKANAAPAGTPLPAVPPRKKAAPREYQRKSAPEKEPDTTGPPKQVTLFDY